MNARSLGRTTDSRAIRVAYTGTDTLKNGYPLCYDTTKTAANDIEKFVTKPTFANLIAVDAFAGVVTNAPSGGYVGTGSTTSPLFIDIIPYDGRKMENVSVWTDQNVAAGDILAPIPGQYEWGRAVMSLGKFQARLASDRSATAGLCNGCFGPIDSTIDRIKIWRHFNDFDGSMPIGIEAAVMSANDEQAAAGYTLQGTSAAAAYGSGAGGALTITPNTTNIGQLNFGGITGSAAPGLPILIATGVSAYFRCRFKSDAIDGDIAMGFSIAGAALADGTHVGSQDDYFMFMTNGDVDGSIFFEYNKDNGTDRGIDTGVDLVAATYIDVAMLIVNRNSGTTASSGAKYGRLWVNGNPITGSASPSVGTDITSTGLIDLSDLFNADEAMRLVAATIGGAGPATLVLDRWEAALSL